MNDSPRPDRINDDLRKALIEIKRFCPDPDLEERVDRVLDGKGTLNEMLSSPALDQYVDAAMSQLGSDLEKINDGTMTVPAEYLEEFERREHL